MFKNISLVFAVLVAAVATSCSTSPESRKVVLFNGNDLSGWRQPVGEWAAVKSVSLNPTNRHLFVIEPGSGIFANGTKGRTTDLVSAFEHGDCQAHIEFLVSQKSNSGVYLQGRYEIQILDSWGVANPKDSDNGGIYHRWKNEKGYEGHAPRMNASKPPGEWQTYDVTFRAPRFDAKGKKTENARFIKVIHNGKVIHENVELNGVTRGGFEPEKAVGPLRLQGDHGPVAYRNVWLKPLSL